MTHQETNILCLGLNQDTSSVTLREKLAYTPHRLNSALARLGCGDDPSWASIGELVILSTCNRVEIYAVSRTPQFEALERFLSETRKVPMSEFTGHVYRLRDLEAAQHLFTVAAGLDSVVVGEHQILGQVAEAYSTASRHGLAGKVLSRLFQTAITVGKRARTETDIGTDASSIASVAVKLINESILDLSAMKTMVLGAGEMAELAVEALRKRGASDILVVNRTLSRAQFLADRWQGRATTLDHLMDELLDADVMLASTGAPHTIIHPAMIEPVMQRRPERPLVIMDIAVPRDVDEDVGQIAGVHLYDMDTLAENLEQCLNHRKEEIPEVETIVQQELECFEAFLSSLDVVPIITQLRQQAHHIRQEELNKTLSRLGDLPPDMETSLEDLTRAIVNKILHPPTARLKEEANGPNALDYASLTRSLFGLDEEGR
jgi:glutamyl-tRNA reductase